MTMTIYYTIIQAFIIFHLTSESVGQFPMPFPSFPGMPAPGPPPGPPGIFPIAPPMMPPPGIHYPLQQKLPVVVMPYYSRNGEKAKSSRRAPKLRRKMRQRMLRARESSSTEDESAESVSREVETRRSSRGSRSRKGRQQVLTPMVSYVTKDGYVVYQKKIKRDKAMDWLEMGKGNKKESEEDKDSSEYNSRRLNSVRRKKHKHSH